MRDGRFLLDALGLPVLGTYRERDVPSVISNAGFLYPLSMSGAKDRMYFTRWRGHQWSDGLVREPRLYGH